MNITVFILIVTMAAFCGGLAGSLITNAFRQGEQKKEPASHEKWN